ncbi:hypothetical protein R3P38DRAFT_3185187 [Favolaschia claudopus]|uniref:Uncharacterized protein n=1 Tax=Favolaschia claudopus TaxID=2862362 RepID=A0AAW0C442_9AGAR
MTQGLWFSQTHKKALGTVENATYDEKHRFNNSRTKLQGELRAVLVVLPEELHGDMEKTWFMHTFNSAITRNDIGAVFVAHLHARVKDGLDTCRYVLDKYVDLVGGRKDAAGKMTFRLFDAPALHSDGADRLNVDTFLNHNLVMHIAVAIIYGKKKANKMARNQPFHRLRWYKVVLDFVCKVMLGPLPETADDRNQKAKSTAAFQY